MYLLILKDMVFGKKNSLADLETLQVDTSQEVLELLQRLFS